MSNPTNGQTSQAGTDPADPAQAMAEAVAQASAISPQQLSAAVDEAVRRAVGAQVAEVAKKVAKSVLGQLLTDEVIAGMQQSAHTAITEALAPPTPQQQEAEAERKELHFKSVEDFVREYLAPCYAREVSRSGLEGQIRWCPMWHEHAEAVARLTAMWRAWEHLRHGEDVQMSQFWRDHADHHMAHLLDPKGPFEHCSVAKGHSDKLVPLPLEAAPPGAFGEAYEQLESGLIVPTGVVSRGEAVLEFP
ncbi:DUF4913 domain-containing protein [Nocardia vinacea]|uniref:DUF4913 domain-containing protein n=1 Tax=Nocardia vinacea TaxID=96468 RepID=UPI00344222AF